MADRCPECGEPMDRADDFWYCDNPRCPQRRGARDEAGAEPPAAQPERKPQPDPAK